MKYFFNKKINTSQGFTLLELLLYVAISSILLTTISLFLSTLLQSRIKNQTISEVDGQGMVAMELMAQIIRNADTVSAPAAGATGSSLTLTTTVPAQSPTVFDLAAGALRITEGATPAIPLTNSRITVSSLSFQNLSRAGTPGTIRIQFTISAVNNSGRNEYAYQKTFTASATLR